MKKPKRICLLCDVRTPPNVKYGVRVFVGTELTSMVNDKERASVKYLQELVEHYLHLGRRLFVLRMDITKRIKNDHTRVSLRNNILHPEECPRLDYVIKRRGEQWIWKAYIGIRVYPGPLEVPQPFTIYKGRLQHEVDHSTWIGGSPMPQVPTSSDCLCNLKTQKGLTRLWLTGKYNDPRSGNTPL